MHRMDNIFQNTYKVFIKSLYMFLTVYLQQHICEVFILDWMDFLVYLSLVNQVN